MAALVAVVGVVDLFVVPLPFYLIVHTNKQCKCEMYNTASLALCHPRLVSLPILFTINFLARFVGLLHDTKLVSYVMNEMVFGTS